jgi:hypothetical protein
MLGVPGAESFWIFGFEEDSADAADACHGRYATRLTKLKLAAKKEERRKKKE